MRAAPKQPIAFMLASTHHGSMIVNRHDYRIVDPATGAGYGVGHQLMTTSCFDAEEVQLALCLLTLLRRYRGDGLLAVDGGANLGVHAVEWARFMHGWGQVHAFEAQERVFYALAGNLALNNCFNARAHLCAIGARAGSLRVPVPDYLRPSSFGSLELKKREATEFIGQPISYEEQDMSTVPLVALDDQGWSRLDLLKLDIEGMEVEGLEGARQMIMRGRPVLQIEQIKADPAALARLLQDLDYQSFNLGINLLGIPKGDPLLGHIQVDGARVQLKM